MKKICSLIFSLVLLGSMYAQQKKVTGSVVDANDNAPMPGVTIQIKGTSTGTITDVNGKFEISATPDAILVISFIGMATEEVAVGDQTSITVKMVPDIAMLDELVVVGYGT